MYDLLRHKGIRVKRILSLLLVYLPLLLSAAPGESIALKYDLDASGGLVPYDFTGDAKHPGIYGELIPLLMQQAGIQVQTTELPIKRAVMALEKGLLDFDFVSPEWFADRSMGDDYVFSDPIFQMIENFYSLADKAPEYGSTDAVWGKIVGTVFGYYYASESKIRRMDFRSERYVIEGLASKRFEVAILEELAASYWSNTLGVELYKIANHTSGDIVIRLRREHQSVMPQINQAISELHSQGKINAILEKYHTMKLDELQTKKAG